MEFKERKRIKREELDVYLKKIADEVKKKSSSNFFEVETEYEEKRKHGAERAKFEIEIEWEKPKTEEASSEPEIVKPEIGKSAMSIAKQEMKVIQKGLLPLVDSGNLPEIEKINRLIELNSIFAEYSKGKEWESEHILFTPKLSELKNAAAEKNLEKTKALAYEISALKKACHQKHIKNKE